MDDVCCIYMILYIMTGSDIVMLSLIGHFGYREWVGSEIVIHCYEGSMIKGWKNMLQINQMDKAKWLSKELMRPDIIYSSAIFQETLECS